MMSFFLPESFSPNCWSGRVSFRRKFNNKTADCKPLPGSQMGMLRRWWSLLFWGRIKDHSWEHCSLLKVVTVLPNPLAFWVWTSRLWLPYAWG